MNQEQIDREYAARMRRIYERLGKDGIRRVNEELLTSRDIFANSKQPYTPTPASIAKAEGDLL